MLKIIDVNFNQKDRINHFKMLRLTHTFSEIGDCELKISVNDKVNLTCGDIIFVKPERPFYIESKQLSDDEQYYIYKGFELKGITKFRRVFLDNTNAYFYKNQAFTDVVIKDLIYANMITPTDINRKFPNVTAAGIMSIGSKIYYKERGLNLADEIERLAISDYMGWGASLDLVNGKIVFDCYLNRDRTNEITFSKTLKNLKGGYKLDLSNYKNVGYIQSNDDEPIYVIVGNASGFNRRETLIETNYSSAEQTLMLSDGQTKLNEMTSELSVTLNANNNVFEYEKDYLLGDKVNVINELGTKKLIISKVTEFYENDYKRIEITLGYEQNKLSKILKRK